MENKLEEYKNTIELMKLALKFYADKDNYINKTTIHNADISLINLDLGYQARYTLETLNNFELLLNDMSEEYKEYLNIENEETNEDDLLNSINNLKKFIE